MSRPGTSHVAGAVQELLDSERKYVHDLGELHRFKEEIEQRELVPKNIVHEIFLNLKTILGFQQKFLAKVETISSQSQDIGRWGFLFTTYEEAFSIYYPFIANSSEGIDLAVREFKNFALIGDKIFVDSETLRSFLQKPLQRLHEYPVLLKNLRDSSSTDEEAMADIHSGIQVANRVLRAAALAVDLETRNLALSELCSRVHDWKNLRLDHFGDLLLCGQFALAHSTKDSFTEMKEYNLYFFEQALLCCKELKAKTSLSKRLFGRMSKASQSDRKPELFIKGRLFVKDIKEASAFVEEGFYSLDISYLSVDNESSVDQSLIIRFPDEEVGRRWRLIINGRKENVTE
ncbi:cdc24 calponin [Phlyctema vagabunda]|uniref:Cdc24 calponin n=1 Tax=Phlyctema vagabunda TaxID=108571 RepID=A0ABR4PR52_9HELO